MKTKEYLNKFYKNFNNEDASLLRHYLDIIPNYEKFSKNNEFELNAVDEVSLICRCGYVIVVLCISENESLAVFKNIRTDERLVICSEREITKTEKDKLFEIFD